MLLLQPAITFFASYLTYSIVQRQYVTDNVFPSMEILATYQEASTNKQTLNTTRISDIIEKKFPNEITSIITDTDDDNKHKKSYYIPIASSSSSDEVEDDLTTLLNDNNNNNNNKDWSLFTTKSGNYACLINPQTKSSSLFGVVKQKKKQQYSPPKKSLSLRQLVSQKTKYMIIEENMIKRANWNEQINNNCIPYNDYITLIKQQQQQQQQQSNSESNNGNTATKGEDPSKQLLPNISGSYRFCYRDYVNHEEILAMMCRRWTIERLLFRPQYATELCIYFFFYRRRR